MASVMLRLDDWSDADRGKLFGAMSASLPKDLKERSAFLRMRYVGQGHEIDVPVRRKEPRASLAASFATLHQARYGFTLTQPAEVVSARFVAERPGRNVKLSVSLPPKTPKRIAGPASLSLPDATLWVERGWVARPAKNGAWTMERK
jgi:N-methylhydantoinase A